MATGTDALFTNSYSRHSAVMPSTEMALSAVGKYAVQEATKDEEDVKELKKKMDNVSAVMSLVTVNYRDTYDSQYYTQAINQGLATSCITTQATQNMQNYLRSTKKLVRF